MDQLFVTYLFTRKQCPLPGIGNLIIENKYAENDFVSKRKTAPKPVILFNNSAPTALNNLIEFIAEQKNISIAEANRQIEAYSSNIKNKLDADTFLACPW
ncbi:MAG: hypothetical protein IPJ81_09465 [Chitinophagaceae bacterium]|nr:hypothetical protein [Chitinophagaceae bacterium]